jgi:hypothetical protein
VATITAQATGNWSNTATWIGGVLPGVGDVANSGNFTVTIDQDISVQTLQVPVSGIAASKFLVSSARNITLSTGLSVGAHAGGAVTVLDFAAGSGGSVLTVTGGDIAGDSSSSGSEPTTIQVAASVTINGAAAGGAIGSSHAVSVLSGGSAAVTSATGGNGGYGVNVASGGAAVVTNATGGSGVSIYGVNVASGGAAVVTNATGGSGTDCPGLGVASGGTGQIAAGGVITASSVSPGVSNLSTNAILLGAGVVAVDNASGQSALGAGRYVLDDSGDFIHYVRTVASSSWPTASYGTDAMLTTQEADDLPTEGDVRDGVIYGPSGTLEGTLAVPPPASVAAGVPVDATVGTAALSLADVLAGTGAQIAAATSG